MIPGEIRLGIDLICPSQQTTLLALYSMVLLHIIRRLHTIITVEWLLHVIDMPVPGHD